ncbi:MAG TPA: hypothetical protein VJ962_03735 [Clostridia bacterium]|nr:hypothetical protein [Clostridia bacterium]
MIVDRVKKEIQLGQIFENPKRGTSEVISITDKNISYVRGNSRISMPINEFDNVYKVYKGKKVRTVDLKKYKPKVFSSKYGGHSCNCTFLFTVYKKLGLTNRINGKGVRGNPYHIELL